jgi:acyl-CoA-binding protein
MTSSLKSEFLTKASSMRQWRPSSPPSNRDRLELYALHKQAASGDCDKPQPTGDNKAERGKWSAWKSKSGLSQAEAMSRYVAECDRQIRVYGSLAGPSTSTVEKSEPTITPLSTPNPQLPPNSSYLSGIDSIELLASAASESLPSYMSRLAVTSTGGQHANHFWARQIPLYAANANSVTGGMECGIIALGKHLEKVTSAPISFLPFIPLTSLHALSYPLHVILLTTWIVLIYLLALTSVSVLTAKTLLLGSSSSGYSLSQIDAGIIKKINHTVERIYTDSKYSLPVRAVGMVFISVNITTEVSSSLSAVAGEFVGSLAYVGILGCTWWYYYIVVPWLVMAMVWASCIYGVGLGVVEAAGV